MYKVAGFLFLCDHVVGGQKIPCLYLFFKKEDDFKLFIVYSVGQGNGVLKSFSAQDLSFADKLAVEKEIKQLPSDDLGNHLGILEGTSAKMVGELVLSHPIVGLKDEKKEGKLISWKKPN